jgi:hypothetical protein
MASWYWCTVLVVTGKPLPAVIAPVDDDVHALCSSIPVLVVQDQAMK